MKRAPRWFAPLLLVTLTACGSESGVGPDGTVGPMVGHVDHERAYVWFRPREKGTYTLELQAADEGGELRTLEAESRSERDRTIVWEVGDLEADTTYRYVIRGPGGAATPPARFMTAPAPGAPARIRLALGSCASLEDDPVWDAIAGAKPDALVLLGDTPYVDTTDLAEARAKHRSFLAVPSLARLLRAVPLWSTWDDHDYGADRGDGTLEGKAHTRRAYIEYRAHASYGRDDEGIYSRVRYGPVEVFLLDTRWFANLERLASAGEDPSCLGRVQRLWLLEALRTSDAPIKLLVSGMVWHDKGGRAPDDWETYAAERDALFAFIGKHEIAGCVLVGGDVHACQHAVFEETDAGCPLHQLVISPLHARAWRGGDRHHGARRWGAVERHVFLLLDIDTKASTATLTATWMRADGKKLHRIDLDASTLRSKEGG